MVRKSLRDGRKSLYLFALVFVVYSFIYMTKNCYSAALASIVSEGIMTKSETGLITAMFYIIYAPFQIVGGIAADRHSPHKLIIFGTLGAGICNILVYFFSDNYIAMLIIWSANAVVQFGIWPAVFKIISSQLCEGHRTRAVFLISFSGTLGLLLSYICAAIITDWRFNFLFSAITLFVCAVVFLIGYLRFERNMVQDTTPLPTPTGSKKKIERGAFLLIIKAGIPMLLVVYAVQGLLSLGIKSLAPIMLMENYDSLSTSVANALNIILVLATPLGMFASRIPLFKKLSETTSIVIMFAASIPALVAVTFVGKISLVIVMIALTVLMAIVTSMTPFFSYISKSFEKFGLGATLSGLFNAMSALGIVLANYVFAKLAEAFGWGFATKGWLVLSIASLLLTAIAMPIWNKFKKNMDI